MADLYNNIRSTLDSQQVTFTNSRGDVIEAMMYAWPVLMMSLDQAGNLTPSKGGQAAPNYATGQVATSGTAGTLVAAKPTRRSVTVTNLDGAINVFVGPPTVTAANGFRLGPGLSHTFYTTALLQVIAASGTPSVAYVEYYD